MNPDDVREVIPAEDSGFVRSYLETCSRGGAMEGFPGTSQGLVLCRIIEQACSLVVEARRGEAAAVDAGKLAALAAYDIGYARGVAREARR